MAKASLIPTETIQSKILWIRSQKVILDRDLAQLYGVETKQLNQAVKRNIQRFPEDFMFRLTKSETRELVTNCDHLVALKFSHSLPFAFTEHGILMLSSVLNSERAIEVNIQIMRMFNQLRQMLSSNAELKKKIEEIEKKYDYQFKVVFEAIKKLIDEPVKRKRSIGFHVKY